jgi:hypothetical protein
MLFNEIMKLPGLNEGTAHTFLDLGSELCSKFATNLQEQATAEARVEKVPAMEEVILKQTVAKGNKDKRPPKPKLRNSAMIPLTVTTRAQDGAVKEGSRKLRFRK